MSSKPKLVPKLRFPAFQGKEGWKQESLGSLGCFTRGLTYSSSDVAPQGLLVLRSTNIQDGGLVLNKDLVFVGKTCPDTLRLKKGDIVVCMSNGSKALVGKSAEYFGDYTNDLTVGAFCSIYRPSRSFAKLAFQIGSYQKYVADLIAGGNINNLTNTVLEEFVFPVPCSPPEQQKIAECLSSVDDLITAQSRKLDALKAHKKGLIQQLFPREGETQPRLRFPEFRKAGAWDSKPLGDLGEIVTGKTPSTKNADLWGGNILFITPTDISEDSKYQHTAARTVAGTKNIKLLPEGSILFTCIASIGKMALTVRPSITNQQINAMVPNKRAQGEFLYYALASLTSWIKTIPATNTLPIINKTDFSKIAILHPEDKDEQQRIASCLSNLDALISAEIQKLEALKTHKRGLMQQLFPAAEEVEA